jgi:hypothetical protein
MCGGLRREDGNGLFEAGDEGVEAVGGGGVKVYARFRKRVVHGFETVAGGAVEESSEAGEGGEGGEDGGCGDEWRWTNWLGEELGVCDDGRAVASGREWCVGSAGGI